MKTGILVFLFIFLISYMMHEQDFHFKFVPPGIHRQKAAERAIWTVFYPTYQSASIYSIMDLASNPGSLPGSNYLESLISIVSLHPPTPGVCVIVHEKSDEHSSWFPRDVDTWYTCNTLSWLLTKVTMPIASSNDLILTGIQDILEALRHPTPGSPIDTLTDSNLAILKILSELIAGLIPIPKPLINPSEPVPVPPLRVTQLQSLPQPLSRGWTLLLHLAHILSPMMLLSPQLKSYRHPIWYPNVRPIKMAPILSPSKVLTPAQLVQR